MDALERFVVPAPRLRCHVEVTLAAGRVRQVRLTDAPGAATRSLSAAAASLRARVGRHLETGAESFSGLDVDLDAMPPFQREVLVALLRRVPPGRTVTYAELAALVGRGPGAARAVGGAMASNPAPLLVPCHRVVASGGVLGNYSGFGSTETKRRLLELERAPGFAPQPTQTRLL